MTNRFPALCAKCGKTVPVGYGQTTKGGTRWVTVHIACPVAYVPNADDMDDMAYDQWLDHQATLNPVTEPGMYRLPDGNLAKVQVSKTSGKPYAKRLTIEPGAGKGTFEYEAGLIRSLTASDRLSLAEASAFGHTYGVCCVCGATLTDPKSVAAGIGPVCAGRV